MVIDKLVKSLKPTYQPDNIDLSLHQKRSTFLSESIIPSELFVYSGQGSTLQTNKGELIDLASMTVNCILGQNDPWVNANLVAYILSGRPSFLTTRLGSDFYYKVAKRILDLTKMPDSVINHRQCNGTDVTELAVLAAYKHRKDGQNTLVSFKNSYHGQGLTAYQISGLQTKHRFLLEDSPVIFLDQPTNTYNVDANEPLSPRDARILAELEKLSDQVFAVIIEPIQVNNGVNTPSKIFLQTLKKLCQQKQISLIFDEIQTGFGWLGKITAAERFDCYPNLLALSKAITSGNGPLSVLVSDQLYQDIPDGTGAKTNGADIRSLIASNAVMDRLTGIPASQIPEGIPDSLAEELEKGLLAQFIQKKTLLENYLKKLQQGSHGLIRSVKGDGLIRGLEIVNKQGEFDVAKTKELQLELMLNGVLLRHHHHTLIVKPPIVTTEQEFEKGFDIIHKIIKKHS